MPGESSSKSAVPGSSFSVNIDTRMVDQVYDGFARLQVGRKRAERVCQAGDEQRVSNTTCSDAVEFRKARWYRPGGVAELVIYTHYRGLSLTFHAVISYMSVGHSSTALYAFTSPPVFPASQTLVLFWRKVAYLTTRTRDREGRWVGSQEVLLWNAQHLEDCERCKGGRKWKVCVVDTDQVGCRTCRKARVACDRKARFLYDLTKDDFFPTLDVFLSVYNAPDKRQRRACRKSANKRLRQEHISQHQQLQIARHLRLTKTLSDTPALPKTARTALLFH
ncbi:hypothetical protein C8F04DRAFT_1183235 [Mycena alexandri]|uniref:Uncharacterized protein n=1 Tax=Mycena alexandri TaxID=1745969 RepID=A0AAD6SWL9_9AGAR|nr:hypothetical protein C8F04DRAFT_1183235 [Mycena alexandri]